MAKRVEQHPQAKGSAFERVQQNHGKEEAQRRAIKMGIEAAKRAKRATKRGK